MLPPTTALALSRVLQTRSKPTNQRRNLADVDDLGSLLRYRIQKVTASYQPSRRRAPGLIVGLIPRTAGSLEVQMHQALDERERLMQQRVTALTQAALQNPELWAHNLASDDQKVTSLSAWR